jgi:hypothetical protein
MPYVLIVDTSYDTIRSNSVENSMSAGGKSTEAKPEPDMKAVLVKKHETLLEELRELDAMVSLMQKEYSAKLRQLETRRRPLEDALHHVEALLRFEGHCLGNGELADGRIDTVLTTETSITDAAFSLLEESHQPLHYKDIADTLADRGIYIPGKNPSATLLSRISRDGRFKRAVKRGFYALSTWRIPSTRRRRAKKRKMKKR